MFHVSAYTAAALGTTANTDINAVTDGIITIQNNHLLLPMDMMILGVQALSPTCIRARITSPKLRQITQPQIRPVVTGALGGSNPNFSFLAPNKLVARKGEELAMQATANPGTTEVFNGIIFLATRIDPIPAGDIITLRGTSTTTVTANAWSLATYTLDDQLPAGIYSLIGSEVISTNGLAHRWIMDNYFFRPGCLSLQANGNRTADCFHRGDFGELGRFANTSLPRLELLANAGDASHTIFMQVVQVSGFQGQSA